MKIQTLTTILVLILACLCGCSKNKTTTNQKICGEGPLFYKSGDKFLNLVSAFTPDADGRNDVFYVMTNISRDSFTIRIYQPDGKMIFQSDTSQFSWTINDVKLREIYKFYVETTIKNRSSSDIIKCSPLFLLQTEKDKYCVVNAKAEDTSKYVFADQLLPDGRKWSTTNQCFKF